MAFLGSKSFEDLRIKDDGYPTHTTDEQVNVFLINCIIQ